MTKPSLLTSATIVVGVAATLVLGVVPGPVLDLGGQCGTIHQVTTGSAGSGPARHRRGPRGAAARTDGRGREGAVRARAEPGRLRHRDRQPPDGRRRQAVPAAAGAARRRDRRPPGSDEVVTAACVVEITHLGSLYHDDVMDEAELRRGADTAHSAGTTTSRSSPATSCSRSPPSSPPSSAPTPSGSRRRPSPGWSRARSSRPSRPARARTRSRTTSRSSPARPAR